MNTSEMNVKTRESSSRIDSVSLFSKNDSKLQKEKLLTATKFHDIIGMLDTH